MSRLIIGAPRPNCISNMAASKLDLRVITHDVERRAGGCSKLAGLGFHEQMKMRIDALK
jgi:hypothetical protein